MTVHQSEINALFPQFALQTNGKALTPQSYGTCRPLQQWPMVPLLASHIDGQSDIRVQDATIEFQ
jgi:hypothetical protein